MPPAERHPSKARWRKEYEEFRAALVRAREEAGLTQREAARRMGRTQSFVAKSESGERRVDVVELAEFASAYGKKIQFFFATHNLRREN